MWKGVAVSTSVILVGVAFVVICLDSVPTVFCLLIVPTFAPYNAYIVSVVSEIDIIACVHAHRQLCFFNGRCVVLVLVCRVLNETPSLLVGVHGGMRNNAIVGNIGHFDDEIDLASSEGLEGMKVNNIVPCGLFVCPVGHSVIVLAPSQQGRCLLLPKEVDERAKLDFLVPGAALTVFTQESKIIWVSRLKGGVLASRPTSKFLGRSIGSPSFVMSRSRTRCLTGRSIPTRMSVMVQPCRPAIFLSVMVSIKAQNCCCQTHFIVRRLQDDRRCHDEADRIKHHFCEEGTDVTYTSLS